MTNLSRIFLTTSPSAENFAKIKAYSQLHGVSITPEVNLLLRTVLKRGNYDQDISAQLAAQINRIHDFENNSDWIPDEELKVLSGLINRALKLHATAIRLGFDRSHDLAVLCKEALMLERVYRSIAVFKNALEYQRAHPHMPVTDEEIRDALEEIRARG